MKSRSMLILVSSVFFTSSGFAQLQINTENCRPENSTEKPLYASDFKWGYLLNELIEKFEVIYKSPKRLAKRAYWDESTQKIILPYYAERGGGVELNPAYVQAVTSHIEQGFQKKIIDGVFFPDMGHSHLLIPKMKYEKHYKNIPVEKMSRMYEEFFRDQGILTLYHTAEQLKMLDENDNLLADERIRYRHHTRNLVGHLDPKKEIFIVQNPESKENTSDGIPNYEWWGAGFNLSANEKGCFSYSRDGQKFNFDISLFDLDYDPNESGGFGNF